jgi:hypothetical protein
LTAIGQIWDVRGWFEEAGSKGVGGVNGRRACAATLAVLGSLIAAPVAGAANPPLIVDDDGKDCPAAPYKTIQNAIFAAAAEPGTPTISVCPGEYVEGGGGVGTNALIIIDSVNIKGAGADLVTIKPNKVRASTSTIADSAPNLRNATGAIVMINGADTQNGPNSAKQSLLTVNFSGVTIDGDGVYAEAGVLFRDAQGSISRSRITNVVTTETSYDTPRAGEYKGSPDGIAVASVSAPALANDVVPLASTPRVIRIDHTRIDKYNAAGVLLDGATGDTLPLTASGVTSQGILGQNQIVGRTLCINFEVNGNCSNPQIATNGPRYGQDGVRVTAGSTVNIIDTLLSQNLVQGTDAPVRGQATNNDALNQAAGLRLIGAGASQIQRSNIVDNSYGIFNAQLDGTTANNAVPIKAMNNWWGLRGNATTNPGPAIAPTTNPPTPENPVNSQAAVDFLPFRAGPQSDPQSGEFPVVNAPGRVNDTAPTVGISTDKATYHLGEEVDISAAVGDDFGVKNVVFYDGPWAVGSADRKPYTVSYTLPTDIGCAQRTLTAVAEDSAGQTASSSVKINIDAGDCTTPTPTPTATPTAQPTVAPPTGLSVEFVDPPLRLPTSGADFEVEPHAPNGFKQIDVFLGTTRICTLTNTPYVCRIRPTGGDVGIQEVRAVISDNGGSTAADTTRVEVPRFEPRGLDVKVKSDGRKRTITAELKLPNRVSEAQGCSNGSITLITKRNGKLFDNSEVRLKGSCTVKKKLTTRGTLTVDARFGGNRVLEPVSGKTRRVKK